MRAYRQAALAVALLALSVFSTRPARAELELLWDAPANCPQRDEVFERIRALAGSVLDQTTGLAVEGTIVPTDGRYRLTLLVRSDRETGRRVIESEKCADLGGAAAVTVALLLGVDPSTVDTSAIDSNTDSSKSAAASKAGASTKQGPGPSEPPTTKPSEAKTSEELTRRWALIVRAPIAALDLGPLPSPVFGVGVGVGLRYESWRIVVGGRLSQGQTLDAPDSVGAFGAEIDRMTGELVACHGWRSSQFELAPCAGLALEHVNAQGFGEGIAPTSQRTTWPALGVGGVAHWYALESLAFFLGVTGYVELARPRVIVEGFGEVAQFAPFALGATFGAEWIL